jgi:hypothetical protein
VVCIASGPSLTAEDVERVRAAGHPVIVTNTTFRLAPWADVLFGMDSKWWKEYHKEVDSVFTGRKHWHADHPKPLGNGASIKKWPGYFADVAKNARRQGIEILNASRSTALTCFPRVTLEDVL